MLKTISRCIAGAGFLSLFLLLNGCEGANRGSINTPGATGTPNPSDTPSTTRWFIEDGPDEELKTLTAFFAARHGDTIEFGPGTFDFSTSLVMSHKKGITIAGAGMDKTILNFGEREGFSEGITMSHMEGVSIIDLTLIDAPGFAIKISDSDFVTLRNMRAMWSSADGNMNAEDPATLEVTCQSNLTSAVESVGTYMDSNGISRRYEIGSDNGGYAIYPVLSNNVLLDNVVALGASDAGIYVGQSNDIIVRNSLAMFNVAGYEIENSDNADMHDNIAECNTGGFLIFDLPGLNQYGDKTRTFNNISRYNNTPNFAPGGVVGGVPQGTGFLILGYDEMEIFNNQLHDNRTAGLVFVGHNILGGSPDLRMDLFPEGTNIHDNTFDNNGYLPMLPSPEALQCADGTGPGLDDIPPCLVTGVDDSHASLLPALVQIKSAQAGDAFVGQGAHILWDGDIDQLDSDCELAEEFQSTVDERGKPQYDGTHSPDCRYNAYKFDSEGAIKRPDWFHCISNNSFSPQNRPYMNFNGTDPTVAPSTDVSVHSCEASYGRDLEPLPPAVVAEYVFDANNADIPTDEEIRSTCEGYSGNQINRAALEFNCERLSHYNLFADPTDPRSGANEGGQLFDLTTPLFSDYARKYRIAFLPPGESAQWREGNEQQPNQTLEFPPGSVIAKTFSFVDGNSENIVETRLLIHRQDDDGDSFWEGMAFRWETDEQGNRTDAFLSLAGDVSAVTWNYVDADTGQTISGSTDNYVVPHPNQCGTCHLNDDRPAGDAPIGPKVRLLNREMVYDGMAKNQLAHWVDSGLLSGAPAELQVNADNIAEAALRLPNFQIPGEFINLPASDTGQQAGEDGYDLEVRARAWLESNCAHCHNRKGLAGSTGVFFDVFRPVNLNYGICKPPNTGGSGSGGRPVAITPASSQDSIVSYRIESNDAGERMPPLARSVSHAEAVNTVNQWINSVVNVDPERYPGSDGCAGGF
ncbi:MAG: parallel beta-helix domain-containing protein [Oceanococcus sp.]